MEKIRLVIERTPLENKKLGPLVVTVSIGGAVYETNGNTLEQLFASADKALYKAKNLGRNRILAA